MTDTTTPSVDWQFDTRDGVCEYLRVRVQGFGRADYTPELCEALEAHAPVAVAATVARLGIVPCGLTVCEDGQLWLIVLD